MLGLVFHEQLEQFEADVSFGSAVFVPDYCCKAELKTLRLERSLYMALVKFRATLRR